MWKQLASTYLQADAIGATRSRSWFKDDSGESELTQFTKMIGSGVTQDTVAPLGGFYEFYKPVHTATPTTPLSQHSAATPIPAVANLLLLSIYHLHPKNLPLSLAPSLTMNTSYSSSMRNGEGITDHMAIRKAIVENDRSPPLS